MSQSPLYRIFGVELSPYSVKVRSYFRYKGIPHEWVVRSAARMEEFRQHAKLPLVPLVIAPAGESLQDSTPILEEMEKRFPEPSIHPEEPLAAFVSALIEEYADEWGNKPMFHYRWTYEPDQRSAAERIARENDARRGRGDPLGDDGRGARAHGAASRLRRLDARDAGHHRGAPSEVRSRSWRRTSRAGRTSSARAPRSPISAPTRSSISARATRRRGPGCASARPASWAGSSAC